MSTWTKKQRNTVIIAVGAMVIVVLGTFAVVINSVRPAGLPSPSNAVQPVIPAPTETSIPAVATPPADATHTAEPTTPDVPADPNTPTEGEFAVADAVDAQYYALDSPVNKLSGVDTTTDEGKKLLEEAQAFATKVFNNVAQTYGISAGEVEVTYAKVFDWDQDNERVIPAPH